VEKKKMHFKTEFKTFFLVVILLIFLSFSPSEAQSGNLPPENLEKKSAGSSLEGEGIATHSIKPSEEAETSEDEKKLNISGTKTFEMKKSQVKGDIGHFSTENFDSIPGFHLDQSLHLEIDGNINRSTKVNAVLDDKDDEERRFTVNIEGKVWNFTLGDFPLSIKDTEFTLFRKELRGILAVGNLNERLETSFLYSRSKGAARREQFRGAGQQQEFRLSGRPVVQNSEKVTVDGKLLNRGTDYLIDYEDGVLKFMPKLLPIEITSWIVVEYEVSDSKLAFKRNLMGSRVVYKFPHKGRMGFTFLREADDTTPNSSDSASGTVRPMEHQIWETDGEWKINDRFTLAGENSISIYDPNRNAETAKQDLKLKDSANKLSLIGKTEKVDADITRRFVGKDFRLIGRSDGVTELGERGLVRDILKENGRITYSFTPNWSAFAGLENSRTNLSNDPSLSAIDFKDKLIGLTWKYMPKSQLETRFERQEDRETKNVILSDRDKNVGTLVWDHDFGPVFTQTKIEQTKYEDWVNSASGSRVLHAGLNLGSDKNKKFTWSLAGSHLSVNDGLMKNDLRSQTRNYSIDMNYDPNRVFNARGIFQWRREKDYLVQITQNDEVADSRIQYRPNPDIRSVLKYKVENTTKVVRDPNLDPAKYIKPPSLPVEKKDQEEVVGRFENPVQKRTANFSTSYRLGEKGETNFDWKRRDLKDRHTCEILSFNDRKIYEFRYTPVKKWRFTTEYENGVSRNLSPKNELKDDVKRIALSNEFREGYIVESKYERRKEDDVYVNDNDRLTTSKALDFQRIFSQFAMLEMGLQRNVIEFKQPSREWEKRAALTITPSAKSQRYKFFVNHKNIEAQKAGSHFEGGLNFSQFVGTDTIIDGEIKKVKSSAGINGNGYNGMAANAKMVITF